MQPSEWMAQAGCLGVIDEMWDESTPSPDALRFCFRCPVQKACLEYGLSRKDASDAGVLGGTGLYDREQVRSGRRTVQQVLAYRLARLVDADWDEAVEQDFVFTMPRLASV